MSKYLQFLLVIAYGFLTITALLLVSRLTGVWPALSSDLMVLAIITIWLLFCFSTVYWLTDFLLFRMQVRKPILEEEQRMVLCLHEIQKKAGDKTSYRLRVNTDKHIAALAIGRKTIVISEGGLQMLTDRELSAVLAHEMGHLRSRDTTAVLGFATAQFLPGIVSRFFSRGLMLAFIAVTSIIPVGIVLLMLVFNNVAVFTSVITIIGFLLLMLILNRCFRFLWILNARHTEYRQDAFAQSLGFGMDLKSAFLKILQTTPPSQVDRYFIITRSSHPLIHNRIRRIEKLEGLRR